MAPTAKKSKTEETTETLRKAFKKFSDAVGEVFDDPEVKKSARQFAESVLDASAKVVQSKVEEKEARAKFRTVGDAAQTLGKSIKENFTD